MAKGKGSIKGWITKNGVHIPIYGEYTVRGGVEPTTKGSKFKGFLKKKKEPENGKNKLSEDEEIKRLASIGVKIPAGYSKLRGLSEEEKQKVEEEFNKSLKERPKNFKEGLKQHEGIQQIAEEQNKKVWNGGASNQELYDAADKFAEEKNFNKEKVRDAAFSAFNEKWTNEKNSRQEKFAEENRQKAMQSFKDKKAQEQGFADDASMRSYNEETGVNKETWKSQTKEGPTPNKAVNDYLAGKGGKRDEFNANLNKIMDSDDYENRLAKVDKMAAEGIPYAEAVKRAANDNSKNTQGSWQEKKSASTEDTGRTIEVNGRKINVRPGETNSQAIYRNAMEEQGKSADKEIYNENGSGQSVKSGSSKSTSKTTSTTESYPWTKSFGSSEPSASEYGKTLSEGAKRYNTERKTMGTDLSSTIKGLKAGDTVEIASSNPLRPYYIKKNDDGTFHYSPPGSSFLTKDMSEADMTARLKEWSSGGTNDVKISRLKSNYPEQDSVSETNKRSQLRGKLEPKRKQPQHQFLQQYLDLEVPMQRQVELKSQRLLTNFVRRDTVL